MTKQAMADHCENHGVTAPYWVLTGRIEMGQSEGDHPWYIQRQENDCDNLQFVKCDVHGQYIGRRRMDGHNILFSFFFLRNDILSRLEVCVYRYNPTISTMTPVAIKR